MGLTHKAAGGAAVAAAAVAVILLAATTDAASLGIFQPRKGSGSISTKCRLPWSKLLQKIVPMFRRDRLSSSPYSVVSQFCSSSMDFGDGLAPMELPSLKNRRAALAKRAGFGAVRDVSPLS